MKQGGVSAIAFPTDRALGAAGSPMTWVKAMVTQSAFCERFKTLFDGHGDKDIAQRRLM